MSLSAFSFGQPPWSAILDPSRAINWGGAGFVPPAYTTACATQPTLASGSGNASANTAAIQNALASCDATHNVVSLPAGTYYVAGILYPYKGFQVLRGAGASSTYLYFTGYAYSSNCPAQSNICMANQYPGGAYSSSSLPPSGSEQCMWTAGYTQGATSITLNSCGGAPPLNQTLILDQANDSSTDNGGDWFCDTYASGATCTQKGNISQNADGRVISGVDYSQQQVVYVTGVSGSGSGPYTVTISPGVYFNNVRSGQSPGAWWNGFVQNDGIENLTVDYSLDTTAAYGINMMNCYQCWVKNVRSIDARRDHVQILQGLQDVVRDSYFYQSQSHATVSYGIEPQESSDILIENNIFQQVTSPIVFGQGSGWVIGYNFAIDNTVSGSYMQGTYSSHNAGTGMNLWEGNNFNSFDCDDTWGTSSIQTYFRDLLPGWQSGFTVQTIPIITNSYCRGYNAIGNVLGQPGYHTQYQTYATSTTAVTGASSANTSIYELGTSDTSGMGVCTTPPTCDPLVFSTFMRWGNYDTVNSTTRWNSTEAAPASVPYINANFTTSYFGSLAQTLPPSLYLLAKPTWWRSMPFPPIGPDVSSGNLGICSGTYSGAQATTSGACSGGSLSSAWAGHANAIPAQDCFLNVMGGPPDGSGGVLSFDANACYTNQSGGPPAPQDLTAVVH
ncbi:MAG: hypothetical protein ACLP3R_16640 [Candidatus Korobacteraceae bacterium]